MRLPGRCSFVRLVLAFALAALFALPASAAVQYRQQGNNVAVTAGPLSCVVEPTGTIRNVSISGKKVIEQMHIEVRAPDGTAFVPKPEHCRQLEVKQAFGGISVFARGEVRAEEKGIALRFLLEARFVEDGLLNVEVQYTPLRDFRAETVAYMTYLPVNLYQGQEVQYNPRGEAPGVVAGFKDGLTKNLKWPVQPLMDQNQFEWFVTWLKLSPAGGPSFELICRQGNNTLEDLRKKNLPYFNVGSFCGYDYQRTIQQGDTRNILVAVRPPGARTDPEAIDSGPAKDQAEQEFRFATQLLAHQEYELAAQKFRQFLANYPNHREAPAARLRLGECLFQLKRYPEARAEFEKFIANNPDSEQKAAVRSRVAECYYREKKFEQAVSTYDLLLARDNPTAEIAAAANYWKGEALFQLNRIDQAIAAYQKSLAALPESKYGRYALYSIAVALLKSGKADEAIARFAEVLQKYPKSDVAPQCILGMADAQYAAGRYDEALATYRRLQKEFPDVSPEKALYGIAWCLYELKQYDQALASFRELAAKYPGTVYVSEALLQAGHCLFHSEKYEQAIAEYDRCAELHNERYSDEALFWKAQALIKLDRLQEARAPLQTLIDEYPQSKRAAKAKEQIQAIDKVLRESTLRQVAAEADKLFAQGQFQQALAKFQELLKQNPEGEIADYSRLRIGLCLEKLGQRERALDTYRKLLETSPEGKLAPHAVYQIAWLHHDAGEAQAEAQAWRELAEKYPQSELAAEAWFRLGEAAFDQDKLDEAIAAYSQVIAKYPQATLKDEAQYKRAWAYLKQQKWQQALDDFVQVAQSTDNLRVAADAKYEAGVCCDRLGKRDEALKHFERCAADHPETDRAPLALAEAARIYAQANQTQKAQELAGRILKRYPNSSAAPRAHLLAGALCQAENKLDEAIAHLQAAAANAPEATAAEALARLGECYFAREQWDKALEAFLRVALLYPGEKNWAARAQFGVGQVREKQGKVQEAKKAYREATKFQGTEWAKKAAQRLAQLGEQ